MVQDYVSLCLRYVNLWFRRHDFQKQVVVPPATSRHSSPPPWLLPSGPDQVDELSMRAQINQALRDGVVAINMISKVKI